MSCPDCFRGSVHTHAEPKGRMETMYGLPTYVSPAPEGSTSKSTIFFVCDAFGLELVNNKILCDRYAADTGCRVVAPAIIPGKPLSIATMNYMDTAMKPVAWTDVMGQLYRIGAIAAAMYHGIPFMIQSGPSTSAAPCLKYARALKKDLPAGGKLGVAGFCWGGYASTYLSAQPAVEGGKEPLIDAEFCAHPSNISQQMVMDALTTFKVPYAMAIGDNDMVLSEKAVLAIQAEARDKVGSEEDNDYQIRIYKGCAHGFAVRAAPGSKVETEAAEEAAVQAIEWYKKYLN